jgi:hypothetical protein
MMDVINPLTNKPYQHRIRTHISLYPRAKAYIAEIHNDPPTTTVEEGTFTVCIYFDPPSKLGKENS